MLSGIQILYILLLIDFITEQFFGSKQIVQDNKGNLWYKISDDKWKIDYYVNANHMHLFESNELTPLSPEVPIEKN